MGSDQFPGGSAKKCARFDALRHRVEPSIGTSQN
jgi:hypothetical protein